MNIRKTLTGSILFFVTLTIGHVTWAQSTRTVERTGDVLQLAIPLTAYGMTYLFDNHQGKNVKHQVIC